MAIVSRLRVWRGNPGRSQISPPGVARQQFLKLLGQRCAAGERGVDMRVAEHGAANGQPSFETFIFVHRQLLLDSPATSLCEWHGTGFLR